MKREREKASKQVLQHLSGSQELNPGLLWIARKKLLEPPSLH